MISGIGVFYPDKKPTQRVGIVPDVEVQPTIAGIRAGRDEVLEEALRQILETSDAGRSDRERWRDLHSPDETRITCLPTLRRALADHGHAVAHPDVSVRQHANRHRMRGPCRAGARPKIFASPLVGRNRLSYVASFRIDGAIGR